MQKETSGINLEKEHTSHHQESESKWLLYLTVEFVVSWKPQWRGKCLILHRTCFQIKASMQIYLQGWTFFFPGQECTTFLPFLVGIYHILYSRNVNSEQYLWPFFFFQQKDKKALFKWTNLREYSLKQSITLIGTLRMLCHELRIRFTYFFKRILLNIDLELGNTR